MILIIALRELRGLLASPLAWLFLAASQLLLGWRFLSLIDEYQRQYQPLLVKLNASYGVTDLVLVRFLGDPRLLLVMLLLAAVLAMRSFAEERRMATLPLLLAAPLASWQVVLGKFFGGLAFLWLALLLWMAMPLSLSLGSAVDLGRLAAAGLGLALLGGCLVALGTWASSLTDQPGLAAVLTFIAGLFLMLLHHGAALSPEAGGVLGYLGLLTHLDGFLAGRVSSAGLGYAAILVVGWLALAVRRLDALRVQS